MELISEQTVQDIEKSLALDLLEEKDKLDMMQKIIRVISGRAGIRIMKGFSKEEAEEFNNIPEENFEEMEKYIIAKNPNAPAIFEEEAQKIKNELLDIKL